jgi:dTDP-4-dehydrorhamnose 3,5-epimerase
LIEGVAVRELRRNADDRGYLMELLRADWPDVFKRFGQCYVSMNYPGVIRGWHLHERQWDLFVCVDGMIKVPLYDARDGSATKGAVEEHVMGVHRPVALAIPPGVYHGYVTLGVAPSLLLNFPSEVYDRARPDEQRLPYDTADIPYRWDTVFR